jgi:hypothetical protein
MCKRVEDANGVELITEIKKAIKCVPHAEMHCKSLLAVLENRDVEEPLKKTVALKKPEEEFEKLIAAHKAEIAA